MASLELGEKEASWQHGAYMAGTLVIRVLFRDVDRNLWAQTPCAAILASLGGVWEQGTYIPGMLYRFSKATDAVRAALRCGEELKRFMSGGQAPPMVVEVGEDLAKLFLIAGHAPAQVVTITPEAEKYLLGEPLEKLPGAKVVGERGEEYATQIFPLSSHNLGWALPSLTLGAGHGFRLPSAGEAPAPVINITMDPRSPAQAWGVRLPWRYLLLFLATGIALWGAYHILRGLGERLVQRHAEGANQETWVTNEDALPSEPPLHIVLPTITPPPLGYGTVVIQTHPEKAEIFLNDEWVGRTSPLVLEKKSNRETFKLTIKKKGYQNYTQIFNVQTNERKVIDVLLEKKK